ncbi:serralysin [Bifidobacterium dolichotidis]|uniref:Serralysin n=2 Tax=Bifidobacterium dolichotidis TaxID=2306976 RepID=A0A430FSD2_9BIFI|nr:serralysin [Bifidobacterium dolichotidis]
MESDLALIEPRIAQLIREQLDTHLATAADYEQASGLPASTIAPQLQPVLDAVEQQALQSSEGGKRLRALLVLHTFDAFLQSAHEQQLAPAQPEPNRSHVLDLACAVELFQTAALVHDDIIDDADLRRGKPAAHRALAKAVAGQAAGTGLGIMLGDLLATACSVVATNAASQLPSMHSLNEAFMRMQQEVEIGQVLDLAVEAMSLDDHDSLAHASLNVFRWKTASYTTIAPLLLGMLAAGVDVDRATELALHIGMPLGLAFQLADDLIDVIGTSRQTGKPVGGDIREGKRTVLLADTLAQATPEDRAMLVQWYEAPERTTDQVNTVISLMRSTGAVEASEQRIHKLWLQTSEAIDTVQLTADAKQQLREACARFIPAHLR